MYNNNGQLDIVSTEGVSTIDNEELYLYGKTGYAKSVYTLNNIGQAFVHSTYAISGRHVGSTSESIGIIDEDSIEWGAIGSPYEDELYLVDENQLKNNNLVQSNGIIWYGSRNVYVCSEDEQFCLGALSENGNTYIMVDPLYYVEPNGYFEHSAIRRLVRPVVNLKSTIQITSGDGTQANPYVIN